MALTLLHGEIHKINKWWSVRNDNTGYVKELIYPEQNL